MKIAYCLPDENWIDGVRGEDPEDAAHIQQKYISEGLQALGHTITFFAPRDLKDTVFSGPGDDVEVAPRSWTATGWFSLLRRMTWRFQQLLGIPYLNVFSNLCYADGLSRALAGQDLVFERNSLYNAGAARASKKLGLPYVVFFDADQVKELEYLGTPLSGWLLRRAHGLLRENLKAACRIICVSGPSGEHLREDWGIPNERIVIIPNAVDTRRFRPDPQVKISSTFLPGAENDPLIIFVGNFYKWHDIRTLLEAFSIVLKSHPTAHLALVGDGAERGRMISCSRDLGIDQNVLFTGRVPHAEIPGLINAADIAVVPVPAMKQDLWLSPMKLYEYMSSGKPVIATSTGQIREVIRDGENGFLVPAADASELAAAVDRLISDPALRLRLGNQARQDAISRHSWEMYIQQLEQVFGEIHRPRQASPTCISAPF